MSLKDIKLNKIIKDEFGRISGILALNKPSGITSHDLVDKVRNKFNIRRVGHAGALDPFATGVMLILVGKATKLSQKLLILDKEYEFDILFGISTDTQDPEGRIQISNNKLQINYNYQITKPKLLKVLDSFKDEYYQQMPIYSSIKIDGTRLREYARASKDIEKITKNDKSFAIFILDTNSRVYKRLKRRKKLRSTKIEIEIPKRKTDIKDIKLLKLNTIDSQKLKFINDKIVKNQEFQIAKIRARVSKGTYIRQLAEDIGRELGNIPAMLYTLERTKIGKITINNTVDLEKVIRNI
ncbi:hypothetical protein ACFLY9_00375 [Patescibacteria group bacterium]